MKYLSMFMRYKGIVIISLINVVVSNILFLFPTDSRISIMKSLGYGIHTAPYAALTYSFIHFDVNHLLSNMFVLILYGFFLESIVGTKKVVILYAISALCSVIIYGFFVDISIPCIGASAAVSSILGALFLTKKIPMVLTLLIVLILANDISKILLNVMDNVAHEAHLIGFLIGMGYNYKNITD